MGGTDCEVLGSGWLAQPVNAWSSLAFVVAAWWVLARRPRTSLHLALAGSLVLVGLGSVAFHGPQPPGSRLLHDGSIALLLVVLALGAWRDRWRPAPVAVLALVAGLSLWVLGRTGGPLCDPDSLLQAHAVWHALGALAVAQATVRATSRPSPG